MLKVDHEEWGPMTEGRITKISLNNNIKQERKLLLT